LNLTNNLYPYFSQFRTLIQQTYPFAIVAQGNLGDNIPESGIDGALVSLFWQVVQQSPQNPPSFFFEGEDELTATYVRYSEYIVQVDTYVYYLPTQSEATINNTTMSVSADLKTLFSYHMQNYAYSKDFVFYSSRESWTQIPLKDPSLNQIERWTMRLKFRLREDLVVNNQRIDSVEIDTIDIVN
jgi:hypothetical protein